MATETEEPISFVYPKKSDKRKIIKIVPPDERITRNELSRTEMAAALGYRATQIGREGSRIFVPYGDLDSPVNIAIKELQMRKFPLKLWRHVGMADNYEYWEEFDINTMVLLDPNIPFEQNI